MLELVPPPPGEKKHDPTTQETTIIYHIFGGRTRSQARTKSPDPPPRSSPQHNACASPSSTPNPQRQVWCHQCGSVSNSYESFLTLSLEVSGKIGSLADALHANFASRDELFGANAYRCDTCKARGERARGFVWRLPPLRRALCL